jgi:hypothetical protein
VLIKLHEGADIWEWVKINNIDRRHLTVGQKAMFVQARLEAEKKEAKKRQATSTGGATPQLRETFPQAENGKSRDKAGASVGVSGKSVDKAANVVKHRR